MTFTLPAMQSAGDAAKAAGAALAAHVQGLIDAISVNVGRISLGGNESGPPKSGRPAPARPVQVPSNVIVAAVTALAEGKGRP